ncbi:MAG: helix-turn-helix domain-containing protein [Alphaproteobacteria bacterium]|nr:helix-turn-helix domain-containing protein [Alphaproteobacteria bacterium]
MGEQEVAKMLNVSPGTLRNQRSKKIGLPYVKIGKKVQYRYSDIEDFIEKNIRLITKDHSIGAAIKIGLENDKNIAN